MSAHDWPEWDDVAFKDSETIPVNRAQYNYAKVRIDACAGLQQELDAARLEVERLRNVLTAIRDYNAEAMSHAVVAIQNTAAQALAAQQEAI